MVAGIGAADCRLDRIKANNTGATAVGQRLDVRGQDIGEGHTVVAHRSTRRFRASRCSAETSLMTRTDPELARRGSADAAAFSVAWPDLTESVKTVCRDPLDRTIVDVLSFFAIFCPSNSLIQERPQLP